MADKIISTPENLQVLHEDNHIIIVNKRPGDIVQGDKTGDKPLSEVVRYYLKIKYNKPGNVYLGVVHRLDRPTSGIVVFAKTSKVLPRLNNLFKEKNIEKVYWAIVKNPPPKMNDTLIHFLKRKPEKNKSFAYLKEVPESKKGILQYSIIKQLNSFYLLRIVLESGRHHQIRAQLSTIGSSIKGDLKYGADRSNSNGSIHLHSREIKFIHPVKKTKLHIIAPPPPDPVWDACL